MKNICNNLALVSAVLMVSLTSVPVSADPAFVLNMGRDGLECDGPLPGPLVSFLGHASYVTTKEGNINTKCVGEITGAPPEVTIVEYDQPGPPGTTCKVVITTSGKFIASCHN